MTKYIFKIQILCLALLVLSGCNDFLDKEVLGNSLRPTKISTTPDTNYKLPSMPPMTFYKATNSPIATGDSAKPLLTM